MQFMFVAKWTKDTGEWRSEGTVPFGNLSMPPSAQVLNYGQGLFEGMKALTSEAGDVVLFRPRENAKRLEQGARRMCMQPVPHALFLQGVLELVQRNASHVRVQLPCVANALCMAQVWCGLQSCCASMMASWQSIKDRGRAANIGAKACLQPVDAQL